MHSVLPKYKDKLLSVSDTLTDSRSRLMVSYISGTSFPDTNKAGSSAYSRSLHLTAVVMSFRYIRNRSDPRMEPSETPHEIPVVSDLILFILVIRFLLGLKKNQANL